MKFDPKQGKYVHGDNLPLGEKPPEPGKAPAAVTIKPGAAVMDFKKRALALAASRQGK